MKKNKIINTNLFLLFIVLEVYFVYSILTQNKMKAGLLELQGILNHGVNVTFVVTCLSVIFTSIFFLCQYLIARLLIRMFSSYETNIFSYILPRNIALIINICLFLIVGNNNKILFSLVILASSAISARLFYKNTQSLIYAIIFASPIIVDSGITILTNLK